MKFVKLFVAAVAIVSSIGCADKSDMVANLHYDEAKKVLEEGVEAIYEEKQLNPLISISGKTAKQLVVSYTVNFDRLSMYCSNKTTTSQEYGVCIDRAEHVLLEAFDEQYALLEK